MAQACQYVIFPFDLFLFGTICSLFVDNLVDTWIIECGRLSANRLRKRISRRVFLSGAGGNRSVDERMTLR